MSMSQKMLVAKRVLAQVCMNILNVSTIKMLALTLAVFILQAADLNAQDKPIYIISVEEEDVYLDCTSEHSKVGDMLTVIEEGGYMIHPVTGDSIKKKGKVIGKLRLKEVEATYSIAEVFPREAIKLIKPKMMATYMQQEKQSEIPEGKKTITVLPFEVSSATGGFLGIYISDLLLQKLFAKDEFRILDRQSLGFQLDELEFKKANGESQIEYLDRSGVDYLITGTVFEPDVVETSTGIPVKGVLSLAETVSGQNLGSNYVSDVNVKQLKSIVKISLKITDVNTGELKFICTEMQMAEGKSNISLEQGFLGGLEIQGGATKFINTITGKATESALSNLSDYISRYFDGKIRDKSFTGNIIDLRRAKNNSNEAKIVEQKLDNGSFLVTLDKGKDHGFKKHLKYKAFYPQYINSSLSGEKKFDKYKRIGYTKILESDFDRSQGRLRLKPAYKDQQLYFDKIRFARQKNPLLACGLSILFPGGGQYYNGQIGKGLIFTGVYVAGMIVSISDDEEVGSIISLSSLLISAIDAPIVAKKSRLKLNVAPYASNLERGDKGLRLTMSF